MQLIIFVDSLVHHIGNLPPSGQYEVDVSALEPGPHLFMINFDDAWLWESQS